MGDKRDKFVTKDVYLTSYLISVGHPWFRVYLASEDSRRIEFSFEKTQGLMSVICSYMAGSALVDPIRFIDHFKRTRGIIFSILEENRNGRSKS